MIPLSPRPSRGNIAAMPARAAARARDWSERPERVSRLHGDLVRHHACGAQTSCRRVRVDSGRNARYAAVLQTHAPTANIGGAEEIADCVRYLTRAEVKRLLSWACQRNWR